MAFRRLAPALIAALAIGSILLHAQVPGQNINMVSVDPWLQKQNEPSGAVSTVNPCRLLAGANDYRAVNIPGNTGDRETGDAWVGWYTSINCGQTWYSSLMPGYPQDPTAVGKASPVYGLTTAADATVRAGAGGFFAYSFIAFNRGSNVGKVAIARFLDRNTTEAVTKPETAITYVDTKVWDTGSSGNYIDKPMVTVSPGTGTCTVAGKTIPASTVHLTWTVFVGNSDDVIRTKVYYARSSNCGATLDGPATKLSEGYAITQSASAAVAANGDIYVVWRQFTTPKGDLNQILVAKSVDGGKTFTKGTPVPLNHPQTAEPFTPFDQGTSAKTFRTNAYPAIATDASGRLYMALSVRGFAANNQARIVVSIFDGTTWSMPQAIENQPTDHDLPGHQIMPAMTTAGGKVNVVWLDFRDDASREFHRFIKEIYPTRHTMDVRGAQGTIQPGGSLTWASYGILDEDLAGATVPRVSKYLVGDWVSLGSVDEKLRQLQWNRPNLKLYAGGTRPFIGDFIDVAGLAYLFNPTTQTWVANVGADPDLDTTAARTLYAFWTDNRDAKVHHFPSETEPPLDAEEAPKPTDQEGASMTYVAPGAACDAWQPPPGWVGPPPTKTRNANVYMSRITPGLFVAAPTNSKPSVNSSGRIQRSFPVLVQNRTADTRTFRIRIMNQPPDAGSTGIATLVQVPFPIPLNFSNPVLSPVSSTDVIVPAHSGTSRTVYVVSNTKYPRIKVDVTEQGVIAPAVPLTGSTVLNLDSQNADIENADIENADIENQGIRNQEIHNADIENADIENADIENADIENADIENADIENADIENADIENADIENADIENADIENADIENADIENADIENADIENGSVSDYSVELKNDGNTSTAYQVKFAVTGDTSPYLFQLIGRRVYRTPSALGCIPKQATQNQILFNVNLSAADVVPGPLPNPLDPSPKNAIVTVAPGERIKLTLRAWDKDVLTGAGVPANDGIQPFCPMLSPECPVVTSLVTVTVGSVSINTGETTRPIETLPSTPTEVPFTAIVTNTNDSGPGSLRQAILTSNSHGGFKDTISFNIPGAGVHTITPTTPLPQLTEPAVIDGTTQPGYQGSPLVELNGASMPGAGLTLATMAGGSTVRGLAINRFGGNGILVLGNGNVIAGNYIGTNPAGTLDLGNGGSGIQIVDGANNIVGGGAAADRNVISGNSGEGVRLDGAQATGNMIRGNYIGTNAAGSADLGNSASGVYIRRAPGNFVIGNVSSGNDGFAGVAICGNQLLCGGGDTGTQGSHGTGNVVQGNLIGVNAAGTAAIGNTGFGVSLDGTSDTLVGGSTAAEANVIAFNGTTIGSPGVTVFGDVATGNQIRRNSIYSNGGIGIDHGANGLSPNDYADFDTILVNDEDVGPNGFQNFPDLTSATISGGITTLQGTLRSTPGTSFVIDFFRTSVCDPSGFGEGQTFVGSITQSTDGTGTLPFAVTIGGLQAGTLLTALATSPVDGTSEFSGCQMVVPPLFAFSAPSQGGNGHVYEYVPTVGTWSAANTAAPSRSFLGVAGHLATITNAFENSVVDTLRSDNQMRGWIGLTDQNTEGTYQWITGEPFTYQSWSPGEPNNGSATGTFNEDFMEFFAGGVWNDTTNGEAYNLGYVVEYAIVPFPPADLVVDSFTHSPASPTAGSPITFTAVVKNTGTATAAASQLLFKIGGETPGAPGTLLYVPPLAPGQVYQLQRTATLIAQNYINTATADYTGLVGETNESNNTTTDSFTVTGGPIILDAETVSGSGTWQLFRGASSELY